jgi:hypothetical protein
VRQGKHHVEIGDGQSSACRCASHRARAVAWHLGQWRLWQVMVSSPLPALWGVIRYGECDSPVCVVAGL